MNTQAIRQRSTILKLVGVSLCLLVVALMSATPTLAQTASQDDLQLTLSPTSTRLEVSPGDSYDGTFTIFNSGKKQLNFKVYAAPYQVKNENYDPIFSNDTARTQISRWVHFNQINYSIEPGKQADVHYQVRVPESIPDGGQYAAMFAETEGQAQGSITSIKRVGMLLYAHAKGTTIDKGSSEVIPISFWNSAPRFEITQKITNAGNTDFEGTTSLHVKDIFGNEKHSSNKTSVVLPETTRRMSMEWKDVPPLGIFTVTSKATVLGKTVETSKLVLFATPTALFAVIALFALIIAGGIYAVKKRRKKPSLRRR
jgi:hypothetical protein